MLLLGLSGILRGGLRCVTILFFGGTDFGLLFHNVYLYPHFFQAAFEAYIESELPEIRKDVSRLLPHAVILLTFVIL